jgi:hypothetical protein
MQRGNDPPTTDWQRSVWAPDTLQRIKSEMASRPPGDAVRGITVPKEIEDDVSWLRHQISRMRTILRFAKDPRAEAGLRELIAEAEARLGALEERGSARR